MDERLFLKQFGHLADSPEGIKKLRGFILELASHGKLLAQDSADTSSQKVLEQNKIKPLPSDYPYSIPHSWAWVKLENLCSYIQRGKGPKYTENSEYPVVSQKCIQWSGFDLTPARFIEPDSLKKYSDERFLKNGDLLWNSTGTGTIGRVNIFPGNEHYTKIVADSHVTVVRPRIISSSFLWCYLASPIIQSKIESLSSGSTKQTELGTGTVKNLAVPLPPIEEQRRIIEKIDRLMALCDKLEAKQKSWSTLRKNLNDSALHHLVTAPTPQEQTKHWQCLETNFRDLYSTAENVKSLRAAILQLAVQGKLVPQDPKDEPAAELASKIQTEKNKLIAEGKVKKQKSMPLDKDAALGDLPDSWAWTNLSNLGVINPRNEADDKIKAGFVPMPLISQYYNVPIQFEGRNWGDIKRGYTHFAENDVSLAKITPCFENGKSAVMRNLPNGIGAGTTELHIFRSISGLMIPEYVLIYLKSPKFLTEGEAKMTGSAGQKRVPTDYFAFNPFPLPPLAEQKRIVKKVDQLMALCDRLEEQISQSEKLSAALMDSILHHAFTETVANA